MKLTKEQFGQLQDALLSSYDEESLRIMVRLELDEQLAAIARGNTLKALVFNLIEWAERSGCVDDLIQGAARHNPGSPALQQLAAGVPLVARSATAAAPTQPAKTPALSRNGRRWLIILGAGIVVIAVAAGGYAFSGGLGGFGVTPPATLTVQGSSGGTAVAILPTDTKAPTSTPTPQPPPPTHTPTKAPTATPTLTPQPPTTTQMQTPTTAPTATPTLTPQPPTPTQLHTPTTAPTATPTPQPPTPTQMRTPTTAPTATPLRAPAAGTVRNFAGVPFMYVPAGEFLMGSSPEQVDTLFTLCQQFSKNCDRSWFEDAQPQHTVTLDSYWIMQTEVTNAQVQRFIDADGYTTQPYWSADGWKWRSENKVTLPACWNDTKFNAPEQPVACVSWYEAEAFAAWLTGAAGATVTLPTEAQWEKAARGTNARLYPWGNDFDGTRLNYCDQNCTYDWKDTTYDDGVGDQTAPVGSYPTGASPYGALDLAGNVWEWTADWYSPDYYTASPTANPTGPVSGDARVVRGGSWNDYPPIAAAVVRDHYQPVARNGNLGFRVVCAVPVP